MRKIAAFDFDGTITCKDTLFDFIIYNYGSRGLLCCIIKNIFNLGLYAIGLRSNNEAKEKLLGTILRGASTEQFKTMCENYSLKRVPQIIRKETIEKINLHTAKGDTLVIVSASPEDWIKPWALSNGFSAVLATQLKRDNGTLTGSFASKNCYGEEKVNRLAMEFPYREDIEITAYGNSNGDIPMLKFANEGFLIKNNKWQKFNR
ncbi:MAG: haloacid dehalogenase-like hydrolase [Bacteroidaceae bacterium]|nr:haloacid dehalogenase-like hydrolase [Bacteroidaceae bacterium]